MKRKEKKKDRRQLLRQYLENELSSKERAYVEFQLNESEEWREERQRVENYLSTLRNLPLKEPATDLWHAIEEKVAQKKPKPVWFPWWYAYPRFAMASHLALIVVMLFTSSWFLFDSSLTTPTYRVLTPEELNGFSMEAETYVAVHEMNGNVSADSEALITLYTSGWPE